MVEPVVSLASIARWASASEDDSPSVTLRPLNPQVGDRPSRPGRSGRSGAAVATVALTNGSATGGPGAKPGPQMSAGTRDGRLRSALALRRVPAALVPGLAASASAPPAATPVV